MQNQSSNQGTSTGQQQGTTTAPTQPTQQPSTGSTGQGQQGQGNASQQGTQPSTGSQTKATPQGGKQGQGKQGGKQASKASKAASSKQAKQGQGQAKQAAPRSLLGAVAQGLVPQGAMQGNAPHPNAVVQVAAQYRKPSANPKRQGTGAHARFAFLQQYHGKPYHQLAHAWLQATKQGKKGLVGYTAAGELAWCVGHQFATLKAPKGGQSKQG